MTDPEQRSRLLGAKLGALVVDRWGGADRRAVPFPGGAALVDDTTAWVLLEGDAARSLGGPLAWARRAGRSRLHLLVDATDDAASSDPAGAAAVLARRGAEFDDPPTVWRIDGRTTSAVAAVPASPTRPVPAAAELLRVLLAEQGLEVVEEGGVLLGEVNGLEVARSVEGPDGEVGLEIGVGRFDREVGALLHGDLPQRDALARVVDIVRRHRVPGAAPHPLNQLVPERWLRTMVVADPGLVGVADLRPVESAVRRRNLLERLPATAVGTDADGAEVVVVCSTGVDLELVPTAADDRAFHGRDARLVLAVPARDALPVTTELAGALAAPAEVVAVDDRWQRGWDT